MTLEKIAKSTCTQWNTKGQIVHANNELQRQIYSKTTLIIICSGKFYDLYCAHIGV